MPIRDVKSATAAISRASRENRHEDAIHFFTKMLTHNLKPSAFTFGALVPSAKALQSVYIGRQLHAFATKMGLQSNVYVGSALVDLYAQSSTIEEARRAFDDTHEPNVVSYTSLMCGYLKKERLDEARSLFLSMPERNVVSWNALICGYCQRGRNEEAVKLFIEMMRDGLFPDRSSFPSLIIAAANIGSIGLGRSFHGSAVKFLGKLMEYVGNSLVSFYAKCGDMENSLKVFNKITERNVVSWNALICGFAQNGRAMESLEFFNKMQMDNPQPNDVTFLGLFWACNHGGLIEEGLSSFNFAKLNYPTILNPEHYACMVNLLSRSGKFDEAKRFIKDLPFDPGIGFWKALLGGCQIHSNTDLGEYAAQKILGMDPEDVSSYVMLSNAYSAGGRWQRMSLIRREMKERGMRRVPGSSWIEIKGKVHVFCTRDQYHAQKDEIYMVLRSYVEHASQSQMVDLVEDC